MALSIRVKSQFKKDLKKAGRDPNKNTDLLKSLIKDYLVHSLLLPMKYKPHTLTGNWKPHQECHIQPDFLLIWDVNKKENVLILVRCGSHADLFG